MTSDIGAFLSGKTPLSDAYPGIVRVPKPDVLVYNTNQCREVQDWFEFYGRQFGAPVLGIHTPRGLGAVGPEIVGYVAAQIKDLLPVLEWFRGRKLDLARLEETLALSRRASMLWRECLETAKRKPSPWTFFDGAVHMGPIVVLRGTEDAVQYYRDLKAELSARLAAGVAAVEGERYRLYWEGMPVWGRIRAMSEKFESLAACVAVSTYCNSWILDALDPADPWRSMALAYTEIFIARSEEYKENYIAGLARDFGIHGVVFHEARTCPTNTNSRHGLPGRLAEKHGIPSMVFDGDLNDLRCFSDTQFEVNMEAFIEQLKEGA